MYLRHFRFCIPMPHSLSSEVDSLMVNAVDNQISRQCTTRNLKFYSVSSDCGLVCADCGLLSATAVACFVWSNAVENPITVGQ